MLIVVLILLIVFSGGFIAPDFGPYQYGSRPVFGGFGLILVIVLILILLRVI